MIKVALPNKGVLFEPTMDVLSACGYKVGKTLRSLSITDAANGVEFYFLRPGDIPLYVANGTLDAGVTGGLNFSNLGDAAGFDLHDATGYHVGVYAEVGVAGVHLRPALLYVRSGDLAVPGLGGEGTVSFISLPVDVKFAASTPVVQPYALAGPELRIPTGEVFDGSKPASGSAACDSAAGNAARNCAYSFIRT